MPRIPMSPMSPKTNPMTPGTPKRLVNPWNNFSSEKAAKAKESGLPFPRKRVVKEWRGMSKSEKAEYYDPHRGAPEVLQVTDYPYKDEDSVETVTDLDAVPIKQEEQSPGPSSVVLELPLPGPPTVEGSPVASPSPTIIHAPIPRHPLPNFLSLDNTAVSFLEEAACDHYADMPLTPTFPSHEENNLWELPFHGEVFSAAVLAGFNESALPTAVPVTPTTGHHSMGLITPGYTPAVNAQELPVDLNDWFGLNAVETTVPGQEAWNAGDFGYVDQPQFVPQVSVLPPFPPAPAPASVSFPVPVVAGQFNQTTGLSADPHPWNYIAQIIESDPPQVAPPPVIQQGTSLAAVQQFLDAMDREGKQPLRTGVNFWFEFDC